MSIANLNKFDPSTQTIKYPDNVKACFGDSNELTIQYNSVSADSEIVMNSTGNMVIQNLDATSIILAKLGSVNNSTSFKVRNSANTNVLEVQGDGDVNIPQGDLTVATGEVLVSTCSSTNSLGMILVGTISKTWTTSQVDAVSFTGLSSDNIGYILKYNVTYDFSNNSSYVAMSLDNDSGGSNYGTQLFKSSSVTPVISDSTAGEIALIYPASTSSEVSNGTMDIWLDTNATNTRINGTFMHSKGALGSADAGESYQGNFNYVPTGVVESMEFYPSSTNHNGIVLELRLYRYT